VRHLCTTLVVVVVVVVVVAAWARTANARDGDGDWQFIPRTAAQAAFAESFGVVPTRFAELRFGYRDVRAGGSVAALTLRLAIPMPYVLVPGVRFAGIYSLVRIELPVLSVQPPSGGLIAGTGDLHVIDGAIKYWKRIAAGGGFAAQLPAASNVRLGTGKLMLGAIAGIATKLVTDRVSLSVLVEALFSVTGYDARPDVDVLLVQPSLVLLLPRATYVAYEPTMTFAWSRDFRATVPVTFIIGHAFSPHLVMAVEPEWIPTGVRANDLEVRLVISYLGW